MLPTARNALGRALLMQGEIDAAIGQLRRGAKLAPRDRATRFALVKAYLRAGRKEDAVKTWKKALDAFDEERPDEDRRKAIRSKLKAAGVELD